jgi:hypothetical protein
MQETDEKIKQQVEELKEKVRKMLMAPGEKSSQKLNFIDAIQRLGVSYHFEDEIQEILQQLHETLHDCDDHEYDDDLHTVALRFRLLRQQGFYISCGTFFYPSNICKCFFLFIGFKQIFFHFNLRRLMLDSIRLFRRKMFSVGKLFFKKMFSVENIFQRLARMESRK